MIDRLIQSALQTGCLSVESEALIRQILAIRGYQQVDLKAIEKLDRALRAGEIKREGKGNAALLPADLPSNLPSNLSSTVSRLTHSDSKVS